MLPVLPEDHGEGVMEQGVAAAAIGALGFICESGIETLGEIGAGDDDDIPILASIRYSSSDQNAGLGILHQHRDGDQLESITIQVLQEG